MASIRRNKKKFEYIVYGATKKPRTFKYMRDVMKFLRSFNENVDCVTSRHIEVAKKYNTYNSSGTYCRWEAWFDRKLFFTTGEWKVVLKKVNFRGHHKYKSWTKVEKSEIKYYSHYEKFFNKMMAISRDQNEDGTLNNPILLYQLLKIMHKMVNGDVIHGRYYIGNTPEVIKDLKETLEYWHDKYSDVHIFNDWWYWSDRCNYLRMTFICQSIQKSYPSEWQKYMEWQK